jgi:hypothetical protein
LDLDLICSVTSIFVLRFSFLKIKRQTPNLKKKKTKKNFFSNAFIIRNMYRPNIGGPMGGSHGRWLPLALQLTLNGSV